MTDDSQGADAEDDEYEYEYDPDYCADCHWCGGDGWVECDDPIQCTYYHDEYGLHRCSSCGGSGAAKDMTIW